MATGASLLHLITLGSASTTISVPASTTFGGNIGLSGLATNSPLYINSSGAITALASSTAPNIIAATSTAPYFVWQAPAISVVTSSTFPASPVNGQKILLRAGETPYEFLEMTYDATYGKWVSEPKYAGVRAHGLDAAANFDWIITYTADNGGYQDMTTPVNYPAHPVAYRWAIMNAAGLSPQFSAHGMARQVNVQNYQVRMGYVAFSDAAVISGPINMVATTAARNNTAFQGFYLDWEDIPGSPTVKDFIAPTLQGTIPSGYGGEVKHLTLGIRWVK